MAKVKYPNYLQNLLPGIEKVFFKNKFLPDFIFFLVVVALPSSFFNFIPKTIFIDLRLFFLLVSLLYLVFNIKYLKKITKIKGGNLLLFVVGFILFQIIYSITIQNIPNLEVIKVFRANFYYPIVTLGFLLYAAKMDNSRLYRFFYWLLWVSFAQGVLYIIANLTGIDFYANAYKEFYEFDGKTIVQNLEALPVYNMILFSFCIITVLTVPNYKKHWLWITPLLVTVISIVRNQMVVHVLILILFYFLGNLSSLKIRSSKIIKASFVGVLFASIAFMIFPEHIGRVINKFGFDKEQNINVSNYTEEGTYKVRLDMIEDAYTRTEKKNNLLLGNGYIRESDYGRRDLVFTGDTLISPVIYTEGLLGIFIRCLPILYFLYFGFKNFRKNNNKLALFSLVILVMIIPELVNIVQTTIFVFYHHYLFVFYLLMMILHNDKKIKM